MIDPADPNRASEFKSFSEKYSKFRQTSLRFALAASNRAEREEETSLAKRDLSMRANGTLDTWYGCRIYDELLDYAVNFSAPWSKSLSSRARSVSNRSRYSRTWLQVLPRPSM